MSRSSRFKSADDNAGDVTGRARKQELWDASLAGEDGVSLSSSNPEEETREHESRRDNGRQDVESEKSTTKRKESEKKKKKTRKESEMKDERGRGESENSRKGESSGRGKSKPANQEEKASDDYKQKKMERMKKKAMTKMDDGPSKSIKERRDQSESPKRGKGKGKLRGPSPYEEKTLSVKDRVKSIDTFARPSPPADEENTVEKENAEEDYNYDTDERERSEEKEQTQMQDGSTKENKKYRHNPRTSDKTDTDQKLDEAGKDVNELEPKKPRRQLPKTPQETPKTNPKAHPPRQESTDTTRHYDWSEAMVKELRGQMPPSDSSSFLSESVSNITDMAVDTMPQHPGPSAYNSPRRQPKHSRRGEEEEEEEEGSSNEIHQRGETASYLYHDPEAALRLQGKPKKNIRQSVKKTGQELAVVSQVVLDWVRRKEEPSPLAQSTPWLVNEKGASKADLLARYKFFSSARLRYKARNMIGATGSRHINQRRRASIASGTTLPMSLVPNLGQLSESDESRMANVPRRRVVDTSDLRTCAILQSRLKELKTYPE